MGRSSRSEGTAEGTFLPPPPATTVKKNSESPSRAFAVKKRKNVDKIKKDGIFQSVSDCSELSKNQAFLTFLIKRLFCRKNSEKSLQVENLSATISLNKEFITLIVSIKDVLIWL